MVAALSGKTYIVTGGLGVLGRALGEHLLACGAQVALVDRSSASSVPGGAHMHVIGDVDLSDLNAASSACDQVRDRFGSFDGLINVAGGFAWEKVQGGAISTWDRMYEVNLRTAVVATQAALPHLLQKGAARIVNVGAIAASKATAGMGAYAAAKAGVARLTEALADELKDSAITVNAVLPSIIDTPTNRADMPGSDYSRWVTPTALATVIAFLLSDDGSPITGACLPVAGRM